MKPLCQQFFRVESLRLAGILCWFLFVALGWSIMLAYGYRRETPADADLPSSWPADSQLPRSQGRPCLVLFVHPKCPCSRATIAELEKLLTTFCIQRPDNTLEVCVAATIPRTAADSWAQTDLIRRSLRLANAKLFLDRGGIEASRFGAQISGTIQFFDAAGKLRYAGGVTGSRGQEGENAGSIALARSLTGETPSVEPTLPAFGCGLVLETCSELESR